jgi:predicted phage-related endonuclease
VTDLSKVRAHVEILQYVKARMAELKEMQALSRAEVEEALGDNEVGELDGKLVITFKSYEVTRLDQGMLKADYPEIDAACRKTKDERRFEVK